MKNKMTLILLAALLAPAFAFAQGDKGGGGGDYIICAGEKKGTYKHYVLDVKENPYIHLGDVKYSISSKLKIMWDRLRKIDPIRAERYEDESKKMLTDILALEANEMPPGNLVALDGPLKDIDDANEISLYTSITSYDDRPLPGKPCLKGQLVWQQRPFEIRSAYYTIDPVLWARLDNNNKAITIAHEIIYREMIALGAKDSLAARNFNGLLFTGKIEKYTHSDYAGVLFYDLSRQSEITKIYTHELGYEFRSRIGYYRCSWDDILSRELIFFDRTRTTITEVQNKQIVRKPMWSFSVTLMGKNYYFPLSEIAYQFDKSGSMKFLDAKAEFNFNPTQDPKKDVFFKMKGLTLNANQEVTGANPAHEGHYSYDGSIYYDYMYDIDGDHLEHPTPGSQHIAWYPTFIVSIGSESMEVEFNPNPKNLNASEYILVTIAKDGKILNRRPSPLNAIPAPYQIKLNQVFECSQKWARLHKKDSNAAVKKDSNAVVQLEKYFEKTRQASQTFDEAALDALLNQCANIQIPEKMAISAQARDMADQFFKPIPTRCKESQLVAELGIMFGVGVRAGTIKCTYSNGVTSIFANVGTGIEYMAKLSLAYQERNYSESRIIHSGDSDVWAGDPDVIRVGNGPYSAIYAGQRGKSMADPYLMLGVPLIKSEKVTDPKDKQYGVTIGAGVAVIGELGFRVKTLKTRDFTYATKKLLSSLHPWRKE